LQCYTEARISEGLTASKNKGYVYHLPLILYSRHNLFDSH